MPNTTVITRAEVFDGEGTLALQVDGKDVLYLKLADDAAPLTQEQHQAIIDTICVALGVSERRED